jgi:hypothetical protein
VVRVRVLAKPSQNRFLWDKPLHKTGAADRSDSAVIMMQSEQPALSHEVAVEIGGLPIVLRTHDSDFQALVERRYAGFVRRQVQPSFAFDIDVVHPEGPVSEEEELRVWKDDGTWRLERGDFRAEWDPLAGQGKILQAVSPYAIDSVLRIVHTLIQAKEGGFLLHGASAIRNRRAFLFSGVSGAGKTTISSLAPKDAVLLTDEISYVRRDGEGYRACGTPFAGELARPGENASAPIECLYFLAKGPENRIAPIEPPEALRMLLRNILFFAEDAELVKMVFRSACEFLGRVPAYRLTFYPDARVWDLIQ